MKRLIAIALGTSLTMLAVGALAQQQGTKALRDGAIGTTIQAPEVKKLNTDSGRFQRAYRQQPPLIPHAIDQYEIDLKVNKCLRCHDWPYNVDEGAPKISETHYVDRTGAALDRVAGTRWFCTKCHVPQVNARPLVGNTFRSAVDVK
ncbi:MAG: nitrate reductase cytochrome c-type subunit [Hyphomicrobiales bacterium]|nr:nitrate reductase cytochrome c-type subunit [Hyphomicrobiales bacterium]